MNLKKKIKPKGKPSPEKNVNRENLSLNGKLEKVVDAWWEQGNVVFPMC